MDQDTKMMEGSVSEKASGSKDGEKEDTGMKVVIKKWTTVAKWKWVTNDDVCGICRLPFESTCSDCKFPGDDCPIVFGVCKHYFHMHCIMKWLGSQTARQLCPMCRQEWKFYERSN